MPIIRLSVIAETIFSLANVEAIFKLTQVAVQVLYRDAVKAPYQAAL